MAARVERPNLRVPRERPRFTRARSVIVTGLACSLAATLACSKKREEPAKAAPSASATAALAVASPPAEPHFRQPLAFSAYTATLAADDEAVYVLTSRGAYRYGNDGAAATWELELGDTPALGSSGIAYWRDGALRRAPLKGGPELVLATVPQPPRRLSASGERLVWEEHASGASVLRTLSGAEPRTLHHAQGSIEALTLMDDQAYFVESEQEEWRVGVVPLGGGAARFTPPRSSRSPAMLAASGDVFFYDGPTSSVRRLASDLSREQVVGRDMICSPLAVGEEVYCAQISLIFALPRDGGRARLLAPKRPGTLAAVTTTGKRVAWLLDVGDDRAELEVWSR